MFFDKNTASSYDKSSIMPLPLMCYCLWQLSISSTIVLFSRSGQLQSVVAKNNHLLYTHLIHSVYNNNPFNSLHTLQNWQQTRHLYHYQTCCWNSGRNSSSAKIWAWNGSWLKRTADFNMTTVSFKRSPHATTDRWRFTADLRKKYNKVNGSYSAS